jgi:heterodisulfide reductase subunit C
MNDGVTTVAADIPPDVHRDKYLSPHRKFGCIDVGTCTHSCSSPRVAPHKQAPSPKLLQVLPTRTQTS